MLIPPPLSLYVHLPLVRAQMPVLRFQFARVQGRHAAVRRLCRRLARRPRPGSAAGSGAAPCTACFFGGGTPSLFPADAIERILQGASSRLRFAPEAEITLETNPGTAEHGRFEDYRRAGVNRISFGIQTFDDVTLKTLGRIHDSAQAVAAIHLARDAGFDNFNLDLMYALPDQTLAMAEDDVMRAIDLAPTHISHYQLTLEPNTVFAARPPAGIPDDDLAWDMQERCQALLAEVGYAQYEVSAYARAGRQCAHNLNYWRFGDYLGIGAGAHGKLTLGSEQSILRRWKSKHPVAWLAGAGTPAGIGGDERIEPVRRPFEFMLNALRLVDGFTLSSFEATTGLPASTIDAPLTVAIDRGWLHRTGDRVVPTELGRRFTNDVVALFLED